MPIFMVTMQQTFKRFADVQVEAANELEATDKVERMHEEDLPWGDLCSDEPEVHHAEQSAYAYRLHGMDVSIEVRDA